VEFTSSHRERVQKLLQDLQRTNFDQLTKEPQPIPMYSMKPPVPTEDQLRSISEKLLLSYADRKKMYSPVTAETEKLPICPYKQKILNWIENDPKRVVVICAETGSGKTTQIPQYIFDSKIENNEGALCNIIVTQPRRISAISVAQRVADERGEQLGKTVGYSVRFESVLPPKNGGILFCTTGVLLRMLLSNRDLSGTSHLILDEVHEREINCDFLMNILKEVLERNQRLRIILMSATINPKLFSDYFFSCQIYNIPGKSFQVRSYFVKDIQLILTQNLIPTSFASRPSNLTESEDDETQNTNPFDYSDPANVPYPLIISLLYYIVKFMPNDGSILIFLPGWENIKMLKDLFEQDPLQIGLRDNSKFQIHLLHSSVPTINQTEVFRPPGIGIRKIILSTNIAETSITIPDVVYVIDTARHKEMFYNASKRSSILETRFISKSNAFQRMGRAGRVRNGHYYCLMEQDSFNTLPQYQIPEMQRLNLEEVCLSVKALNLGSIREFLGKSIQPPDYKNVDTAVERLKALQALDMREELTPLGKTVAVLPIDSGLGKMLLLGLVLSCFDPILTIVSAASSKDPFIVHLGSKVTTREKRLFFSAGHHSDQIATVNAYNAWRRQGRSVAFCEKNNLNQVNLQNIARTKGQLFEILSQLGFIPNYISRDEPFGDPDLNINMENFNVIKAIICSGFYPNYAERGKKRVYRTKEDKGTIMHPSSVNYKHSSTTASSEGAFERQMTLSSFSIPSALVPNDSPWFVFQEKVKTTRVFLLNTTQVSPFAIFLFGGSIDANSSGGRTLVMDDWMVFSSGSEDPDLILNLRKYWDKFLKKFYENPQFVYTWDNPAIAELIKVVLEISSRIY